MAIRTARLDLIPGTAAVLEAELQGRTALARALGVDVPPGWPPPLFDEDAIRWTLERLRADPSHATWGLHYFVLRETTAAPSRPGRTPTPRPLAVGAGGFKGPPDGNGAVEIGYSVLPDFQRRGFATEATDGMVERAFGDPRVRLVVAQTLPELVPSIGVLAKVGFRFAGEGEEEGVIRYEMSGAVWSALHPGRPGVAAAPDGPTA